MIFPLLSPSLSLSLSPFLSSFPWDFPLFLASLIIVITAGGMFLFSKYVIKRKKNSPNPPPSPSLSLPLHVSHLFIYPVKCCRGMEVTESDFDHCGFKWDRRWAFAYQNKENPEEISVATSREFSLMIHITPHINHKLNIITLTSDRCEEQISFPLGNEGEGEEGEEEKKEKEKGPIPIPPSNPNDNTPSYPYPSTVTKCMKIWSDLVLVDCYSDPNLSLSNWIQKAIGAKENIFTFRFVKMKSPQKHFRPLDNKYNIHKNNQNPQDKDYSPVIFSSLSDGFPFLLSSELSFNDLCFRVGKSRKFSMEIFRPNIIISGKDISPWAEDTWKLIQIGSHSFYVAKPCSRCTVPLIDISRGQRHPSGEPNETMKTFRTKDKIEKILFKSKVPISPLPSPSPSPSDDSDDAIYFGQNLIQMDSFGKIRRGDTIRILQNKNIFIDKIHSDKDHQLQI